MIRPSLSCLAMLMIGMAQSAVGQSSTIVYKCPGNVYTSERELTAKQADEKGCKVIEGTPITVRVPESEFGDTHAVVTVTDQGCGRNLPAFRAGSDLSVPNS